ncbi:hypothetical protein LTR09_007509 [Extremus antarcticus]|uniref:Amidohydrolase-related domain-containing protein n=1 Tax=Extremus antarcticus TaxID=702011 RepID=A0AAJ0DCM0_9PEZI|nr:hypothetical protein LTR09_007509 [Extremus antarcticus]
MEHFIKPWLPSPIEPSYTFTNANVVDVASGTISSGSTVQIRSGKIVSITTKFSRVSEDGETIVDLNGKYLIPGLIDSHVHVSATPGESDPGKMLKPEEIMTAFRIPYVCRDMLSRGFTTVRDCGGAPAALKSAIEEWLVPGPRLLRAGHALTQSGGHGDFRESYESQDPECPSCGHFVGLARTVDGVAEAIHKTRDELRQGSDFIKVMGSGGMLGTNRMTMEQTQFTPEEMHAITATAAAGGTYTTVHAYSPESIQQAVNNGAKGVEHGNLLDRETAKQMAQKGVFLTPTLVTFAISADGPGSSMLPAKTRDVYRRSLTAGLEAIKIASEEGVEICFGTDLLGSVGVFQSEEFALRAQVQTPLEILRSATVTPAKMIGLKDVGQIREGFVADLLVLKSNPLDDISVLARPESEVLGVVKEGRLCFSRLKDVKGLLN